MTVRIAIYARYSSDLQNPLSIDDQIERCKKEVEKNFDDYNILIIESDSEISGNISNRPSFEKIKEHARKKHFDILIADSLDRLSRNMKDTAGLYEILQYYEIDIWTVVEKTITPLHIGFKGTANAMYIDNMRAQVKRGQIGMASRGRIPAGICYGYKNAPKITENGRVQKGHREIIPEQAEIIKAIFNQFAEGIPIKSICRWLNDNHIPSPSGGIWNPSSISGAPSRHEGVLNKTIYNGWLIYNRTKKTVNPETGKKKFVPLPEHEWVKTYIPELKIIDNELWEKVKKRQENKVPAHGKRKPSIINPTDYVETRARPLTGLIHCGWCNGLKTIANEGRYVCRSYKQNRACKNARGMKEYNIELKIFDELLLKINNKNKIRNLIYKKYMTEKSAIDKYEKALNDLFEKKERLAEAYMDGHIDLKELNIVKELNKKIEEVKLKIIPPVEPSPKNVLKDEFEFCFNYIKSVFFDERFVNDIRSTFLIIVDKIVLTPIPDKAHGENIEIFLNDDNWYEFYLKIKETWL